ncbi:MAG: NAD(P)H-binding protein [Bacteroidetes bacterium]|nr:NAD(P)H-binding protein [Bacteroidota bacterium]
MKITVTGATGMVGAEVIRQAIADNDIESITAIVRRPLSVQHPKLKTVIHSQYLDYRGLEEVFKENDACIWCLGISQSQVSKEEYKLITYHYTMAAANAMVAANPDIKFIFLSGDGADQTEKSSTLFARIKGETENGLKTIGLRTLVFARPGGIWPVHTNPKAPFIYRLLIPLFPLLAKLFPKKVIKSDIVARALIKLAKEGSNTQIVENEALKALA